MRIDRLDHLVLTVADIDASVAFSTTALGMTPVTFGTSRRALAFGTSKIDLHQDGREFDPKTTSPTPGSADLCFIVDGELDAVRRHLAGAGVAIEAGPTKRTGALGPLPSLDIRDPDGNLIELSTYAPDRQVDTSTQLMDRGPRRPTSGRAETGGSVR